MKVGRNVLSALVLLASVAVSVQFSAAGENDPCREKGMIVKNLTTRDLWRKGSDGKCYLWNDNHVLVIRQGDQVSIFSDLICRSPYCGNDPTYEDYKAVDKNGNCAVRILPGCTLSDM